VWIFFSVAVEMGKVQMNEEFSGLAAFDLSAASEAFEQSQKRSPRRKRRVFRPYDTGKASKNFFA